LFGLLGLMGLKEKFVLVIGKGVFGISCTLGRKFEFDRKKARECINLNFKHGEFLARR
jgi:hypothetical protein